MQKKVERNKTMGTSHNKRYMTQIAEMYAQKST